jgi:hypothetical protein
MASSQSTELRQRKADSFQSHQKAQIKFLGFSLLKIQFQAMRVLHFSQLSAVLRFSNNKSGPANSAVSNLAVLMI